MNSQRITHNVNIRLKRNLIKTYLCNYRINDLIVIAFASYIILISTQNKSNDIF